MLEEDSDLRAKKDEEKRQLRVCVLAKRTPWIRRNHCVVELTRQNLLVCVSFVLVLHKQKQKRLQRSLAPDKEAEDGSKSAKKNPLGQS